MPESGRHRLSSRGRAAACAALALLAVLTACKPERVAEPPRDQRLLDRLVPSAAAPGEREVRKVWSAGQQVPIRLREPARVRVGRSDRAVRITRHGLTWRVPVPPDLPQGAFLDVAVAALGPEANRRPGTATVELVTGTERRPLVAVDLSPSNLWVRRRVPLPARVEGGELVLASAGKWPVAWSEVYLDTPAVDPRPDIVLVVIDTLRADHLSAYGYHRPTSPRLDRLARDGALYLTSSSAATWTLPSTASLMTGLPPDRHGVRTLDDTLPDTAVTLAEELAALGYRTAAFTDGGFVDPQWGFGQGFDRYEATARPERGQQRVKQVAGKALLWLEANAHSPYFLFLHTYETHQPYFNRESFGERFLPPGEKAPASIPVTPTTVFDERGLRTAVALYDGEIRRVDHYFGMVLDRLEARAGRTAVLVTSDHGEEFQEHGGLEHFWGKVFDENVRVPLLLRAPGVPAGRRVAAPVSGLDVLPTLLELAGAPERAQALPGRSLLALARPAPAQPPAERPAPRDLLVQGLSSAATQPSARYRLDRGPATLILDLLRGRTEAYDRGSDPGMARPRPAGPADAPLVASLQATLAASSGGQLAVRLPDDLAGVAPAPGSRIAPVGLWDGLTWRPAAGRVAVGKAAGAPLPATPGIPHCLVFRLRPGSGGLDLLLQRPQGGGQTVQIAVPRREAPLFPLNGLTPILSAFPSASPLRPGRAQPTDESLAGLRALGYLR